MMATRRLRGAGGLYRRPGTTRIWMRYTVPGRGQVRQSTGTDHEDEARAVLQQRLGQLAIGEAIGPRAARVTIAELVPLIVADYEFKGRRSLRMLESRIKNCVLPYVGAMRVAHLTPMRIMEYRQRLRADGYAEATIALSLQAIRRMCVLGVRHKRIHATQAPAIELPKVDNARQGYISHDVLHAIMAQLPRDERDIAEWVYFSGWRNREVLGAEWSDYQPELQQIIVPAQRSKTGRARVLVVVGALADILARRAAIRVPTSPLIFHRGGRAIQRMDRAWKRAARRAGHERTLFYDLRRTVITNMVQSGTAIPVVMAQSGHTTLSTFLRYNIFARHEPLHEAQIKLQAFVAAQRGRSSDAT